MQPLFVVGCYRSGTTLLRRICNTHPRVWLAKETQFLAFLDLPPGAWREPLSDDEVAARFSGMAATLTQLGWDPVPTAGAFLASGEERTLAGLYGWLCRAEAPTQELAFWGDNTPRYVSMIPALADAWPRARFLHIVRDPRDVVASALEVEFGGNTVETITAEWIERVGAGLVAERLVGDRVLLVRFEDLVREPAATMRRVAEWLGVDDAFRPDDLGGDAGSIARVHKHLQKVASPLDPSVIGSWRRRLTEAQALAVERDAQPFLAPLGYELGSWHAAVNPNERFRAQALSNAASWLENVRRSARRRFAFRRDATGS